MENWRFLEDYIDSAVVQTLIKNNFDTPTEVQKKGIIPLLTNKDVKVQATTGSGKTLAFVIPVLQLVKNSASSRKKHNICGLIIVPTQELAWQIWQVLDLFSDCFKIKTLLIVGGTKTIETDLATYYEDGGNIIVATPGRLSSILTLSSGNLHQQLLSSSFRFIEVLILDEADRLLEMGFQRQISTILSFVSRQRRTGFYSATDSFNLQTLSNACLRNPINIKISDSTDALLSNSLPIQLLNYYMIVPIDSKFSSLCAFLQLFKDSKIILFFSTTHQVDYFGLALSKILPGYNIFLIHGKLKKKRLRVYDSFKQSHSGLLVASDLVARGLDIPSVDWIIQYDPPKISSLFIHRCGRTARHGSSGKNLLILTQSEVDYVHYIKLNQNIILEEYSPPSVAESMTQRLRKLSIRDRDLYLKGIRSFVSFVNFYIQHECKSLFGVKDIPFGQIANDYGLLHLPHMPELTPENSADFIKTNIDHTKIKFKSKIREKMRKKIERERENKNVCGKSDKDHK